MQLKKQETPKEFQTQFKVMKRYEFLSEIRLRHQQVDIEQQVHKYANLLDRYIHVCAPDRLHLKTVGLVDGLFYSSMILPRTTKRAFWN